MMASLQVAIWATDLSRTNPSANDRNTAFVSVSECVSVCVHNWPPVLKLPQQSNAATQCLLEAETLQD